MVQTMAEHLIEQGKAQGIQQGIEQGKAQGIEQGKAQGIEHGEIKAKQADVLKILRHRFDAVPDSLAEEINSIRSLPCLDALLERVLTANTLDEIDSTDFDG
ncbi:MAG: hypothetical protein OXN17_10720 [Candidatus Poribacteria bacterium]|nr:hypothetical protein [Candidatus Poribacteria bacterium]